MTGGPVDSRKSRRFSVDVEATLTPDGADPVPARARDLSRTGICVISAHPIASGHDVTLRLVLAFSNNATSEPLSLSARVVWCTPIAQSFQIGVMFCDVTDKQDGFLEMFLQFLDGTLAPSGLGDGSGDDETDPGPASPDDLFKA